MEQGFIIKRIDDGTFYAKCEQYPDQYGFSHFSANRLRMFESKDDAKKELFGRGFDGHTYVIVEAWR